MLGHVILLVPPLCLVLAALTDFLEMTIPNRIPAVLLGTFFVIAPFTDLSLIDFGWHLIASATIFTVCFGLFAANLMGGGDAKILAASAIWFGMDPTLFEFLVLTGYFGGALTIVVVTMRANWDKFATIGVKLPTTFMVENKIPYAIAIGAAGLIAYPQSPLMISAFANLR